MKPTAILVVGSKENNELLEAIFSIGFDPLVRENMEDAIEKLRQEPFMAIIVDTEHLDSNIDVLEFILNIRDVVEHIPILVVGMFRLEPRYKILISNMGAVVLPQRQGIKQLTREIEKALTPQTGEAV